MLTGSHTPGDAVTIDRRLRSGDAPNGALLAIWLLTSLCIAVAAMAWPVSATGKSSATTILPLLVGCAALAVAMFALGRTAWRLLGREACIATCLLLPLNPLLLSVFLPQGQPLVAWQLAATACAVWSLSHRNAVAGATMAGCAMGIGCALDPALWPIAAALGVLLFVRWLGNHHLGGEFTGFLKGLVAVSMAGLAMDEVFGAAVCASARLAPFAALAILLGGSLTLGRLPCAAPAVLVGGMAATVAASLAAAALLPDCAGGPLASLALPAALPQGGVLMAALLPLTLAMGAAVYLWRSNEAWLRCWWRNYVCLLGAAGLGGAMAPSLLPVAAMLAVMPLGWLVAQLLFGGQRGKRSAWRPASVAVVALAASVLASAAQPAPGQAAARAPDTSAAHQR